MSNRLDSDGFNNQYVIDGQFVDNKTEETRQWAVLLDLSTLLGFIVPILGFVVPIIIWQWKKTDLPSFPRTV